MNKTVLFNLTKAQETEKAALKQVLQRPEITYEQQEIITRLVHESRKRTDTKIWSCDKMYESDIQILKNLDPPIVKNGCEWRQYTILDATITTPVHIRGNGICERTVPNQCLKHNVKYEGQALAFMKETIYHMECLDGSVEFDTRQRQQDKRRAKIEAEEDQHSRQSKMSQAVENPFTGTSTGSGTAAGMGTGVPQGSSTDAQAQEMRPEGYETPPHLLTNAQLIERYGTKIDERFYPHVRIFDVHVLLQSVLDNMTMGLGAEYGECILDDGGCFITSKGVEKMLMYRLALMPNIMLVKFAQKGQNNYHYQVEIRSEHTDEFRSTSTFYFHFIEDKFMHLDAQTGNLNNVGHVIGTISTKLKDIAFVIWIRGLGVESDNDIRRLYREVCGLPTALEDETLLASNECQPPLRQFEYQILERCLQAHKGIHNKHDAILFLGSFDNAHTNAEKWFWGRKRLRNEVIPHLGKSSDEALFKTQSRAKARLLCKALHELLLAVEYGKGGSEEVDLDMSSSGNEGSMFTMGADAHLHKKKNIFLTPRDSYQFLVSQSVNEILPHLRSQYVRMHFDKNFVPTIAKQLDRGRSPNLYEIAYSPSIGRKVNYNISMGIMQAKPNAKGQTGISQNVGRHNYVETLVQHDKIMNSIHKEGRQIDPRLLSEDAFGIVDSSDTPEGESSGLHRQMAQYTIHSMGVNPKLIIRMLSNVLVHKDSEALEERWKWKFGAPLFGTGDPSDVESGEWVRLIWDHDSEEGRRLLSTRTTLFWNIVVNQKTIGFTVCPDAVLFQIRLWRRTGRISHDIECAYGRFGDPYDVCIGGIQAQQESIPLDFRSTHTQQSTVTDKEKFHQPFHILRPWENEYWVKQARHQQSDRGSFHIAVYTFAARHLREVFVVENLHKLKALIRTPFTHADLLAEGIVEYLGPNESRDCFIAIDIETLDSSVKAWSQFCRTHDLVHADARDLDHTKDPSFYLYPASKRTNTYSHLELDPSTVQGVCTAMIPVNQCNPPARNSFAAHMSKSSQGQATSISILLRMDTNNNQLWISERPLATTQIFEALRLSRLSHVFHLNGDLQAVNGNEEDGTVMNQCTIDLNYGTSSNYHTHVIQQKKNRNSQEIIGLFSAEQCSEYKIGCDYSKLNERGIIREGSTVEKNTILVQKCLNGVDKSFVYPGNKFCVVDKVEELKNEQDLWVIKVRLRETRKPKEGDKMVSQHAQKVTMSTILRRENMMYDYQTGCFADIIYSPISKVSRMTLGMLNEGSLNKIASANGIFADATPLKKSWMKSLLHVSDEQKRDSDMEMSNLLAAEIKALGYHPSLCVSKIDMRYAKRVKHSLILNMDWQMMRQRQMVVDKSKARGTGPNSYSTKQPQGNKALHGVGDPGQKVGVMEGANLQGYGVANMIYDRMLLSSDPIYIHVCKTCSKIAVYNEKLDTTYCLNCEQTNNAFRIPLSGTFNLFMNEVQAINSDMKLLTRAI